MCFYNKPSLKTVDFFSLKNASKYFQIEQKMNYKRTTLPVLALSVVIVLILVTQLLFLNYGNIKRMFSKPIPEVNSQLHSLANLIKTEGPTIKYPHNWFGKNYSKVFVLEHVCPCKLKRRTKKDLIIVAAQKSMTGAVLFMRTLRRTGYFSPVVIMADGEAMKKTTNATKEQLSQLGAHIIPIGYMHHEQNSVYSTGIIAIYDFLKSNTKEYDRVLVCDLFDIVFQDNPFNFPMANDTLYFVSERITFNESEINKAWIMNDIGEFPKEWENKEVINSGQVMGDIAPMLVFLNKYIEHLNLKNKQYSQITTPDQAIFNILIHSGELNKSHIPYVICRNQTYSAIMSSPKYDVSKGFYNVTDNGVYIPIIHQYYVSHEFSKQILEQFPRDDGNLTDYMRTFSEEELTKICNEIFEKKRKAEEERRRIEDEAFRKAEEKRLAAIERRRKRRLERLKKLNGTLTNSTRLPLLEIPTPTPVPNNSKK